MKTSLKNLILYAVTALSLSVAGSASAVSILQFGGSTILVPGSPGTADSLTAFRSTDGNLGFLSVVNGSTGIFASLPVGTEFEADSPLVLDPGPSAPSPLYTFEDYSFVLDVGSLTWNQGGGGPAQFLNIFGSGTIFGPSGFEEDADLALSATGVADSDGRISLQGNLVTNDVPEGGSAVILLGMGMIGMEALRRRMKADKTGA